MNIRFYRHEGGRPLALNVPVPEGVTVSVWRPRDDGPPPAALPRWPNAAWWAFDRAGVFANRNCGVVMLHSDGELAHSSLVSPRYFRFPDMGPKDLQIGATWTAEKFRGRGLAKLAIQQAHSLWAGQFEHMWYIVEDDNHPSIRVIEACGYALHGRGARIAPLGIGPLARYQIDQPA